MLLSNQRLLKYKRGKKKVKKVYYTRQNLEYTQNAPTAP